MQQLNRLWQLANAASAVRDLTQQTRTMHFAALEPLTFFLRTEYAAVEVARWDRPLIEVTLRVQGSFAWRVLTDHDDAGVYVAASRRPLVGSLGSATFQVHLPHDAYVVLDLNRCRIQVNNLSGQVTLPPTHESTQPLLTSGT